MSEQQPRLQDRKQRAQTVEKALQVLNAVAQAEQPLTLGALGSESGLEKTTTHRLATSLARGGILRFDPVARTYSLGWKLIELGALAARRTNVISAAEPHLAALRDETSETVHLGGYDDGEVVYLAQKASTESVVIRARVGQRRPVHCTAMGKTLLAFGPREWLEDLIAGGRLEAMTPNTITEKDELVDHLTRVRRLGYSVDDEEVTQGIRCVSVPVRDHTGLAVASISVSGPAFRIPRERLDQLAQQVRRTANAVSAELGYIAEDSTIEEAIALAPALSE